MPVETLTGPDIPSLLARASTHFGPDTMILASRRAAGGAGYEMVVTDARSGHPARRERATTLPNPDPRLSGARLPGGTATAPSLVALVGPTGAGKTTTVAKLATHQTFAAGRRVALLCLDTFRVGAVEQLGTYAEIAGLPLAVVHDERELPRALRRLHGCDLILVDTAGRGPRGQADQAVTRRLLHQLRPRETHLVLPAGLQPALAGALTSEYLGWGATHLLPTKLDEAPDDDTAFSIAARRGLPMRWYADGQDVPSDLHEAELLLARARLAAHRAATHMGAA